MVLILAAWFVTGHKRGLREDDLRSQVASRETRIEQLEQEASQHQKALRQKGREVADAERLRESDRARLDGLLKREQARSSTLSEQLEAQRRDFEQAQRAQGLVPYGGRWISAEDRDKAEADKRREDEARQREKYGPNEERSFIRIARDYAARYQGAGNELQRSSLRTDRAAAMRRTIPSRAINNWVGTIKELGTTGKGHAHMTIRLPDSDVEVRTWNNVLSDIGDGTLIEHGSELYRRIEDLSVGTRVVFSGQFVSCEKDHCREVSLTEAGGMRAPEYVIRFTDIRVAR